MRASACLATLSLLCIVRSAPAAGAARPDRADDGEKLAPVPVGETGARPVVSQSSYWAQGVDRWFMSARVDVGFLFFKPRASFGFGRPFHRWVGVPCHRIRTKINL